MSLSERQRRLLLWRDYFMFLREGIRQKRYVTDEEQKTETWFNVLITELESDVMHLEQGQPEYCTWDEVPKDLSEFSHNIDV